MKEKNPYISIIMASRNDNYQGDALSRLQMVVSNLIAQARQYNLRAELIIIDWNPPPDRPLLKDAVSLPDDLGSLVVRFIIVPSSIHKIYRCSDKINIIRTAALNVGIRRAQREFVLTTNSDILFSNELIHFLSLEKLKKSCFYRAFRYDVHRDVLKCASLEKRLDFCKKNIVQAFRETEISPHGLTEHPILQTACGADFIVFSKEHWHLLHGYPDLNNLGLGADVLLCYMAYLAGLKEEVLDDPMRLYHIDHDSQWRTLSKDRVYLFVKNRISNRLDYDNRWRILLRRIYMLKNRVSEFFVNIFYHLFGSFLKRLGPPGNRDFNHRYLIWECRKVLLDMLKGKRSYIYNNAHWGLPNEDFREFVISSNKTAKNKS